MIGLGLNDFKDISLKGYERLKQCDYVYLDFYTSVLQHPIAELEGLFGKSIILADRALVEQGNEILDKAEHKNVAFLVGGDVFSATTHMDLFLRAKQRNIEVEIIHNASILNAIGDTGLQIYNFGKTTSIPFPQPNFKPETAYEVLVANQSLGLHTLVLLDLDPKQGHYMQIQDALSILLDIEEKRQKKIVTLQTKILGCARIGGKQRIRYGTIKQLLHEEFGDPLFCLVFPGKLHFMEEDVLKLWE